MGMGKRWCPVTSKGRCGPQRQGEAGEYRLCRRNDGDDGLDEGGRPPRQAQHDEEARRGEDGTPHSWAARQVWPLRQQP